MLGFHAAWMPGTNGKPVPAAVGTQALWDLYPQNIRHWINARGGPVLQDGVPARLRADGDVPECHTADWVQWSGLLGRGISLSSARRSFAQPISEKNWRSTSRIRAAASS